MKLLAPLLLILSAIVFSADATKPSMAPDFGAVPMVNDPQNPFWIYAQTGTTMVDNRKTLEQWAKENGKALVTKAECDEVVKALERLLNYESGVKVSLQVQETSTKEEVHSVVLFARPKSSLSEPSIEPLLEKWRKRAVAIKEVKP